MSCCNGCWVQSATGVVLLFLLVCLLVQVVAFGEGHNSWVMRVQFDPWSCGEATSTSGPPGLPPTVSFPLIQRAQLAACCQLCCTLK
jgi:hypothetical protein